MTNATTTNGNNNNNGGGSTYVSSRLHQHMSQISHGKQMVNHGSIPKKISHVKFGLLTPTEMQKLSEFQVSSRDLFVPNTRLPAVNGCMDPRLGISEKKSTCQTCKMQLADCSGHFGFIHLELPVFHIGYFKHTLVILQCICKTCCRIMLPPVERQQFLQKIRNPNMDALGKASVMKGVIERCKKSTRCPSCLAANGTVKKVAGSHTLKLIHEIYKSKYGGYMAEDFKNDLSVAFQSNKDLEQHFSRAQDDLSPLKVMQLFTKIPDEDCELLWMDVEVGRPENLLLKNILVPPVPIRPSVAMDTGAGSNEDDLTVKLQEIIYVNNTLQLVMENGGAMKMVMEQWDYLQVQVSQLINSEIPGLPRQIGQKPSRGLCQRLKGKQGRFRGNLSGKRVDFSARTVISPDPNLMVTQVGVPERVAKIMTYPEKVNRYNIEKLRQRIRNGPQKWPGANQIRYNDVNAFAKSLSYGDREKIAQSLNIGDTVERHMDDDDIVLFNRQPSLHKMSIMSHRAKILQWRTFRFNECVCSPYNADFDGDEMNLHFPQTEEARTEAINLMGVQNNIVTPRNGEPLVAATQDFLTGSYLLCQRNVFYNRQDFCRLVAYLGDAAEHIEMPEPCILKPVELWSGKQIFSLLIKPNDDVKCLINFEQKESFNTKGVTYMCPNDGYVCFRNGELVCGAPSKKTLGENKNGLFYVLLCYCGALEATRCMNRLAKLCARFIGGHRGFSISINDVTPDASCQAIREKVIQDGYDKCTELIEKYKEGTLPRLAGCTALETIETELNAELGNIRQTCGTEYQKALPWGNSIRIMAECGSKGSSTNISQMAACVGQQSVGGKRIQNGFVERTLPHFELNSLIPPAKGFVRNSFYTGLTATEFFFHTMGGREGLVDTAVKTAETGYMARRLMKALEDLYMHYNGTVVNSEKTVIQLTYGDDGLNPSMMENDNRPIHFNRLKNHIIATMKQRHDERPLTIQEIKDIGKDTLASKEFIALGEKAKYFQEEVSAFCEEMAERISKMRKRFGMEDLEKEHRIKTSVEWAFKYGKKPKEEKIKWLEEAKQKGTNAWKESMEILISNTESITKRQLEEVIAISIDRYKKANVEPGEAVGAIGAQSISEPTTQMTLKTFHFAGVASMNVTLGVPRLKEIINASKTISTPIIKAQLVEKNEATTAQVVKAKIESTTLGSICISIKEVYAPSNSYISIKLDLQRIRELHLDINSHTIKESILKGYFGITRPAVLRQLKENHVQIKMGKDDKIRVYPPDIVIKKKDELGHQVKSHTQSYFTMQALKVHLPLVIVKGVPAITRVIINQVQQDKRIKDQKKQYELLLEGTGLEDVLGVNGLDGTKTTSNHIMEVQQTLGIEAARQKIQQEISYIIEQYGIGVDPRHKMLLADVMTFKGEVLGITRFGVAKMRESVLMLASFEKTTDHLFDACVHGRTDAIDGVSECIIMGIPIPLGTGLFKLLRDADTPKVTKKRKPLLI